MIGGTTSSSSSTFLLPIASSTSISKPRKLTPRKNYLRPKLPKIKIILPPPPPPPLHLPQQQEEHSIDQFTQQHLHTQQPNVQPPELAKFTKHSFYKFAFCFAAALVVQSVCTLWIFNSNEPETRVSEKAISRTMQRKIEEIRVMARAARERERENNGVHDGNGSDVEEDEEEEGFVGHTGIQREVDEKLSKLREKLERNRDKIPERFGKFEEDVVDVNQGNEGLVFKKKYKYKGSLSDHRDRPKGFTGRLEFRNEAGRRGSEGRDGSSMLDDDQRLRLDVSDGNGRRKDSKDVERSRHGKNVDVEESKFPKVQDRNSGSPVGVTADAREPNILKADEVRNSLGARQQLKKSGSFTKPHSGSEWWEKLPHVLVILMQKRDDGGKVSGLYTLKSSSGAEGESSHIVAFQDRGDATNFCYLLQLYFEDLGDFSIDIVPVHERAQGSCESKCQKGNRCKEGSTSAFCWSTNNRRRDGSTISNGTILNSPSLLLIYSIHFYFYILFFLEMEELIDVFNKPFKSLSKWHIEDSLRSLLSGTKVST